MSLLIHLRDALGSVSPSKDNPPSPAMIERIHRALSHGQNGMSPLSRYIAGAAMYQVTGEREFLYGMLYWRNEAFNQYMQYPAAYAAVSAHLIPGFAEFAADAEESWTKRLVEYRDHLDHLGASPSAKKRVKDAFSLD